MNYAIKQLSLTANSKVQYATTDKHSNYQFIITAYMADHWC